MTRPVWLSVVIVGAVCWASLGGPAAALRADPRHLFLDDHDVALCENLQRTMHAPVKRGAVIRPDRPWETVLQTRSAPAWDEREKLFKLWLITSTPVESVGGMTYVESKNGLDWIKPNLGQWEFQGSRENNFVTPDPALSWPEVAMENAVYDPDDPDPTRRYKGFLEAFARQPIASPDGIHWRRLDAPKLASQDESNLSYDREGHTFLATFKMTGPYGRSHAIWTSSDFLHWTNTGAIFGADEEDQRLAKRNIEARLADPTLQQPIYRDPADYHADIYNVGLFRYEGLYLALPAVYHATGKIPKGNTDGFHLIQLAVSHDLKQWQRLGDRRPFLGPSPVQEDTYDWTQLLPPSAPIVRGDELWFYYTGLRYREPHPEADPRAGAICLAVLRRDGFVSLDAGEEPGTLVTKPLVAGGANWFVNVDAAQGAAELTVLDDQGRTLAVSEPIVGDQPRAAMRWKSGDVVGLQGKTVQVRFVLRQAKLYSFWMDP